MIDGVFSGEVLVASTSAVARHVLFANDTTTEQMGVLAVTNYRVCFSTSSELEDELAEEKRNKLIGSEDVALASIVDIYYSMYYFPFVWLSPVLNLSRGWGFNPSLWCLSTPYVCIDPPEKIVKISQKHIADPLPVFPQIEYWLSLRIDTNL